MGLCTWVMALGSGEKEAQNPGRSLVPTKNLPRKNSAIIITLQGPHQHFLMINEDGKNHRRIPGDLKD